MGTSETLEYILKLRDQTSASAKNAAGAIDDVADQAQIAADKLDDLSKSYSFGARQADIYKRQLDALKNSEKATSDQVEKAQLRYDKATASLQKIERQAVRTAEGINKVGTASSNASVAVTNKVSTIDNSFRNVDNSVRNLSNTTSTSFTTINSGLDGMLGHVGKLAGGFLALQQTIDFAKGSWNIAAEIEANQGAINRLIGGVERGNAAWSEAANFARKYGFTQQEISGTLAAASPIIKKYNTDVEQTIGVLARLSTLNTKEGIEGATVAFKELASGDITSMVERFNLGRKEVQAMNEAIKAGADPVAVLDAYLSELGVTQDALIERTQGLNGANNSLKQGFEDLKLSFVQFLEAVGAPEALSHLGQGLQSLSGHIKNIIDLTSNFGADGFTTGMQMLFVDMAEPLQGVAQGITGLVEAQRGMSAVAAENAASMAGLAQAANEAAGMSDHHARAVQGLTADLLTGEMTIDEYADAIYDMLGAIEGGIGATDEATDATANNTEAIINETLALDESTQAALQKLITDEEAAAKANENAQQQAVLGAVLEGLATQTMEPREAMFLLTDAFGVTGNQAQILYAQLQALAGPLMMIKQLMGMGGNIGKAIGGAGAGAALDKAISIGLSNPANIGLSPTAAALAKKNRGGGGGKGKKGGKSDAEREAEKAAKEAEKLEKAEQKALEKRLKQQEDYKKKVEERTTRHYERIAQIEAQYQQKAIANEKKFNGDKFSGRGKYYNDVAGMDASYYKMLVDKEEALWKRSQQIAQEGRAAEAQAFLEYGREITLAQAQRDQEILDLQRQRNEAATEEEQRALDAQIALRQRGDDLLTEQENQKLKELENATDSAKAERDEALTEERADYQEALAKLRDDFVEALDTTDQAVVAFADTTISMFNAVAKAAAEAQAAAHAFTPGSTVAPESRQFGGRISAGRPYIINDGRGRNAGPELIVPDRSGTVIPADRTAAIQAAMRSVMPMSIDAPRSIPTPSGISPIGGGGNTTYDQSSRTLVLDMRGNTNPRAHQNAEADVKRWVREEMDRTGRAGAAKLRVKTRT